VSYELHIKRSKGRITPSQWTRAVESLSTLRLEESGGASMRFGRRWIEVFAFGSGQVTFKLGQSATTVLTCALTLAGVLKARVVGDGEEEYTSVEQLNGGDPDPVDAGIEAKIQKAIANNWTSMDLRSLFLRTVPASIRRLTELGELNLFDNELQRLPDWICELIHLETLKLTTNQLTKLPDGIGALFKLRKFFADVNQLTSLPESMGQWVELRELNLRENQIADLPTTIGKLTQLKELSISGNQLRTLPATFGQLTSLQSAQLSSNLLTLLPDSIGNLRGLRELDLTGNNLQALPESMRDLKLDRLLLHGNDSLGIPAEILGPDKDQILFGDGNGNECVPAKPKKILSWYFKNRRF
jgi:hypothetical protein